MVWCIKFVRGNLERKHWTQICSSCLLCRVQNLAPSLHPNIWMLKTLNVLPWTLFVGSYIPQPFKISHFSSWASLLFCFTTVIIKAMFTRDRICSDPFGIGSIMVRIHSVYTGAVLNWNGKVPNGITLISVPIWYQIADPIPTRSTRSDVNTKLIRTNFVLVPNWSGPV